MAFSFKKRLKDPDAEAPAKKPPKKSAQKATNKYRFPATRGPKFVIFIGDEGAILVYVKGNVVQSRQFVSDASEHNLNDLRQTILADPLAPIYMVVDSMDQSFVQQTLPPVSSLSVGKLIKRRLERDFGVNDIKGAISLGREKSGRKDWNFMMIALEKSPQLMAWLDFIEQVPNRFRGIRLVSVEAEILVKNLERAMGVPKEGTGSRWKFFVSHNKVGGFRQVILRDGRLVFTRMAQPVGEANMEVIAGNIEQEMLSTIEYMKRLAYNPQEGLDIYIVASSGIKEAIDRNKFHVSSLQVLTPFEVAEYLHIKGATQPTDQFGDVILASAIGCLRKSVLTLSTPTSRKIDTFFQLVYYQRLSAILATFALVAYASNVAYDIYTLQEYTEDLIHKKSVNQRNLSELQATIDKTHLNVDKAHDLIKLYEQMGSEGLSPLPTLRKIREAINPPILLKSLDWQLGAPSKGAPGKAAPPPNAAASGTAMTVTMTLEFPSMANDPKVFAALSAKVLANFKAAFPPPYDVSYPVIPDKFQEKVKAELDFNDAPEDLPKEVDTSRPELQIVIIGEVVKPASPASPALILSQ